MRATIDVPTPFLVESLVRAKAFHPKAHQAATLVIAQEWVSVIDKLLKRHNDTNRYVNGWIQAAQQAGVTKLKMYPFNASSRREQYLKLLEEQYNSHHAWANSIRGALSRYEVHDRNAAPRKDGKPRKKRAQQPHVKKLKRELTRVEKTEERSLELWMAALANESIIFFDRRAHHKRPRQMHTVRHEIYGGTGRLIVIGGQVVVELENLEAHARLVERNPKIGHPVRSAYGSLKSFGLRRASNRYMETMEKLYKPKPGDAVQIVDEAQIRHARKFAS